MEGNGRRQTALFQYSPLNEITLRKFTQFLCRGACRSDNHIHTSDHAYVARIPMLRPYTLQKMRWDFTTSGVEIAHQLHFPPWWFRNAS